MKKCLGIVLCLYAGVLLCLTDRTEVSRAQGKTPSLTFKALSGEETGLKAIMDQWKDAERKAQGEKFGASHSWWPWGLATFDYDNDGCLDLLVQQHGMPSTILLRGQFKDSGKLTFVNVTEQLGVTARALPGTFRPHIWDIDGDGWLDIVGTDAQPNTCFFNKGGKKFEPMKYGFGQLASLGEVGDLNGDGYLDVYSVREGVQYLFDPQNLTFKKSAYLPPLHANPPEAVAGLLKELKEKHRFMSIRYFEGMDLNGDGIPDLVVGGFASYGGPSLGRYLIGTKDGKFTDQTTALGLPTEGTPIMVRDLTGDGTPSILIATGPQAGLYTNDGKGHYRQQGGDLQKFLAPRAVPTSIRRMPSI